MDDARVATLSGLIDYAGLFPPARLDMAPSLAEYAAERSGPSAWMLGGFVCPASRMEEMWRVAGAARGLPDPLDVVVVLDGVAEAADAPTAAAAGLASAAGVAHDAAGGLRITAVEAPLGPVGSPAEATERVAGLIVAVETAALPEPPRLAIELSWRAADQALTRTAIGAIAAARAGGDDRVVAKVRTGGTTADVFPSSADLARVIVTCAADRVPLKATAGLHHPLRRRDDATGATMHGFLNLIAASALAESGASEALVAAVLEEDGPGAVTLTPDALVVGDRVLGAEALAAARRDVYLAHGSCSIAEPVEDLVAMGVLGDGEPLVVGDNRL